MSAVPTTAPPGAFAALRRPVFAVLWAATVLGNTGSFMRDVASAWLVTDLSASPAAVAMVQAAGLLPIFLLAIPAGVLADILDRRRFLIVIQLLLASVSITLMLMAKTGALTVTSLIGLTFIGGIGAALMGPTWQAIVPELVPKSDLKGAVALNSLGVNIARAIGPAVGGLLLASFGAAVTYGADVASYVFVLAALVWWKRKPDADDAVPEHFLGAFRAGLRFTRASRPLHVVLLRAGIFYAFGSAIWALLPLVAKQILGGDAGFYGLLLGAVGVGAIMGALLMPQLRKLTGPDGLVLGASVAAAAVMVGLAFGPPRWAALAMLLVLGAGWIVSLTTFSGAAQGVLPNWVRGRGLAVYLTVFNGAMAAGSLGWGAVAQQWGVPVALWAGAIGLVVVGIVCHRLALPTGDADLDASRHWPDPMTAAPVDHDRGPVLILIEYHIEAENLAPFLKALKHLSSERRRDGAYAWGVSEDSAEPTRIVEWFMVESWAEHLRQHHRVSNSDADLQRDVVRFHTGAEPPKVQHLIGVAPPA
jgi:MFS family permease